MTWEGSGSAPTIVYRVGPNTVPGGATQVVSVSVDEISFSGIGPTTVLKVGRSSCSFTGSTCRIVAGGSGGSAAQAGSDDDPGNADPRKCIDEKRLPKQPFHDYKVKLANVCKIGIAAVYRVCEKNGECKEDNQFLPSKGSPMFPVSAGAAYPEYVRAAFRRR